MLRPDLLTFGVAGAVFRIAGEMRRLPAYFDNPVLLCDANYDRKNNVSTYALCPCRFNSVMFPQILYDIVLYA